MNDRYLFKAKRVDNGEWVQGYLFDNGFFENVRYFIGELTIEGNKGNACNDWDITGTYFYEIDPKTISQCTGWKDKEKNLIWENDIVSNGDFVGVVKFGYYDWDLAGNIGFYIDWNNVEYRQDLGYWLDKIRVIGSIFDKPKLLEAE